MTMPTLVEVRSYQATIPAATSATVDGAARIDLPPDVGGGADQRVDVVRIMAQGILPTDLIITASGDSHRDVTIPLPPSLQAEVEIRGSTSKGVTLTVRNVRQADVTLTIWYRGRSAPTTNTLATAAISTRLPDVGGRPAYYDRNPADVAKSYLASAVAPAGETERWSYTVPSGRRAILELLSIGNERATAAASGSLWSAYINLTPAGESQVRMLTGRSWNNTAGVRIDKEAGASVQLQPGDTIQGSTEDVSTGGTISWCVQSKFTEYDF